MHTGSPPPWISSFLFFPYSSLPVRLSATYWRPPTATGLPHPFLARSPPFGVHAAAWRQAQDEARYVIKVEQDRLDRLSAAESENLKRAEEALAQYDAAHSGDEGYVTRPPADDELQVQRQRQNLAKLRADNAQWLSHLIKQETDRIHAAMIEDELEGRLTTEETEWLERNIQMRKEEEARQAMKRAQEEEAEHTRKLEEAEEATKLRATRTEELSQATRQFAQPGEGYQRQGQAHVDEDSDERARNGSPRNCTPPSSNPTHHVVWSQAQEAARHAIKTEQDRLDRLLAAESESLRQAENALSQHRARHSGDDSEYRTHLLAEEERRVHAERERVAELRKNNSFQLAHFIKQEMDRIYAATTKDNPRGLDPRGTEWVDGDISVHTEEERRQSQKLTQETASERAFKLQEGKETGGLRAGQAEEVAKTAPPKLFVSPPIPDLNPESSPTFLSDPFLVSSTLSGDRVGLGTPAKSRPEPFSRPSSTTPNPRARHMDARSNGMRQSWTTSTDVTSAIPTFETAHRVWANNLKSKRELPVIQEEHLQVPHPYSFPLQKTASSSTSSSRRSRPSSQENNTAPHYTEETRLDQEHQEGIRYYERSTERTAREAQKTGSVRNPWGVRSQQGEEVRESEEEREEVQAAASWERYEKAWQDLLSDPSADCGLVRWPRLHPEQILIRSI